MLWFLQLLVLRLQKWSTPFPVFWRRHVQILRSTAQMVAWQDVDAHVRHARTSPVPYVLRTIAFVTMALTVAGGSWYVAVDMTTASDLTAIYNCSAFFAYAFSVPLLHERLQWGKVAAVAVAVLGVFVVAYGDTAPNKQGSQSGAGAAGLDPDSDDAAPGEARNRALGNIVIGVGSVLYGLYEVLYKRLACPPDGTSAGRSMIFANFVGTCIGLFTLTVLWIPLPLLHYTGLEVFELPRGEAAWMLGISVFANAGVCRTPLPRLLTEHSTDSRTRMLHSLLRLLSRAHQSHVAGALFGRGSVDHLPRRTRRTAFATAARNPAVGSRPRRRLPNYCCFPHAELGDVPRGRCRGAPQRAGG